MGSMQQIDSECSEGQQDEGRRGRREDGTHSYGVHGDVVSLAVGDDLRQLQVVM